MIDSLTPEINARTISQALRFISDEIKGSGTPQPMIIVGNPGSGKSTILHQLASQITDSMPDVTVTLFDGKRFFNSDDIILAIDRDSTDNTKRHIVFIDDLDFFFNRASYEDQYILRNFLNRGRAPLLVGTISSVGASLTDYRAPFFEGVRLSYIPAVELDLKKYLADDKSISRIKNLLGYLPPVIRSILTAAEIVAMSDDSKNDLSTLIARMAPHYRSKYEALPQYSQKILYTLAQSSLPENLSRLKELTDLQSGTLSTYLRHLVDAGEIRKTDSTKRGAPYEICDPLFKLWLSENA